MDAFISQDFQFITIDEDIYFRDTNQSRRRFSLGHEIGHYALHKNLYEKLSFKK
ncbi:MAG: ImmA/IrrE family metallo-endopeptidase [Ignavibacteria bacterium]|nr:ImmA/IrrE family metallo-endopeptidase [Ignavibacteria bacterium]